MDDSKLQSKCQSIYRNLLHARGVAVNQNASVFIRELQHTARCDEFYDFSAIRKDYANMMGIDSMKRIATFDEVEKDERRAEQAVVHYFDYTQSNLVSALDWLGWIWHHTLYKAERTVAALTSAGVVFGGWRYVRSAHLKWQQQQQQQQPAPAPPPQQPGRPPQQ